METLAIFVKVFLIKNIIMNTKEEKLRAFERILDILDELREKCPWDRKQTLQSLRHLTLEEVYIIVKTKCKRSQNEM